LIVIPGEGAIMVEQVTLRQFREADGLDDWRVLGEGVCAYYRTGSFEKGARLVSAIGELPDLDAHHPDVDLRYDGVTVRLITITEDYYGLSQRDMDLARQITATARDLGVHADPMVAQTVQVTIDALVAPDVLPFWRAVLGYVPRGDNPGEDLIDPRGRGPAFWFQRMDEPRRQRNRIHLDVWVAHELAETRIEAALAAGGRLLTDKHAPSFWVLADSEGNEACVCTALPAN
jgi:4a-hydroxytetrahydrobiopterin dehydratase